MPKARKPSKYSGVLPRRRQAKQWSVPPHLNAAFRAHKDWPNLKAVNWQRIAREQLGLDRDIAVSDRKYNVIRQHCKNERRRRNAKAQV